MKVIQMDAKDFLEKLMDFLPVLPNKFVYVTWIKGEEGKSEGYYLNLGISPLYRDYVSFPFNMGVELGTHTFINEVDSAVFLIDSNDSACGKSKLEEETIKYTNKKNEECIIPFFPKFDKTLEEGFIIKIEHGQIFVKTSEGWKGFGDAPTSTGPLITL